MICDVRCNNLLITSIQVHYDAWMLHFNNWRKPNKIVIFHNSLSEKRLNELIYHARINSILMSSSKSLTLPFTSRRLPNDKPERTVHLKICMINKFIMVQFKTATVRTMFLQNDYLEKHVHVIGITISTHFFVDLSKFNRCNGLLTSSKPWTN